MATVTILVYCALVAMASLAGGWLPTLIKLTHLRQQLMLSLVSGVMLGVALLHLLPHAAGYLGSVSWVGGSMLCGVLTMFFLVRVFHIHAHEGPAEHDHSHDHAHGHSHDHAHGHDSKHHHFSWAGLFVGLAIHSLLDGVAMAASVVAESSGAHATTVSLLGLGTFLAVVLHKPLDALSITSLMQTAKWSESSRAVVNLLFASCCPIGAVIFWLGASQIGSGQNVVIGCALAFSAGFFLCIALSDLLPEVAFHSHDRLKLSTTLLLGVALAIGIEVIHPHQHDHGQTPGEGSAHEHQEGGSHQH